MNKKLLFTLALPVFLCQIAQAQTSSRLVGQADWTNDGAKFKQTDSTALTYGSEARGGDLTHTQKFDNSTTWVYVNDSAYENSSNIVQVFDANNNISMSTYQYWSGTSWVLSTRMLYTYTSDNKMATSITQYWGGTTWVAQDKHTYTYDTKGNMILDVYQAWNGLTSKFDNYNQKTYTYDIVTNKLLNETDEDTYTGSPVYTQQYVYTYTTDTQLLTTAYNTWSSGWMPSTLHTNTYDVAHNRTSDLYQIYNSTTMAWVNQTYDVYSMFTGNHMPQMRVYQVWDMSSGGAWLNNTMYMYTYNGNGQLTTSTGQSWNVVGLFEYANGDQMSRYYYQTYNVSTAVNTIADNSGVKVYPVPASNMLHVELNWTKSQEATIAIYDMSGKMVSPLVSTPAAAQYHTALSLNNLASGNYIVKINSAEGQVVKQIVVAK